MILIISKPFDPSTENVIDWLYYFKASYYRLNGNDVFSHDSKISLSLNNNQLNFKIEDKNKNNNYTSIQSVWFRRDETTGLPKDYLSTLNTGNTFPEIMPHISKEIWVAKRALYSSLKSGAKALGCYKMNKNNKIETLIIAKKNKLDVPDTLITNQKSDIKQFIERHDSIITKAIGNMFSFANKGNKNESFQSYTEEITNAFFDSISDTFSYSLFQEKLKKELDIRVFYLDGACYSMAIFSQHNTQTSTDFRKYVNNRNVPYKLPELIEGKIDRLMKEIGLNTGSIDMIKTTDGRMVFLEVNPVGQYDMTSVPCNYNLDKEIAQFLITHKS